MSFIHCQIYTTNQLSNITSYLRAPKLGEEITIEAEALKIGKTLSFLTVDLTDSKGRLVAQGKHTKFARANVD